MHPAERLWTAKESLPAAIIHRTLGVENCLCPSDVLLQIPAAFRKSNGVSTTVMGTCTSVTLNYTLERVLYMRRGCCRIGTQIPVREC